MTCALCSNESSTSIDLEGAALAAPLCETCAAGLMPPVEDAPHWQCLHEQIWSTDVATQVAAYRILKHLDHAPWARDLMEIAYLEPDVLSAAQNVSHEPALVHRDSNGAVLSSGDTVVLIKDLPVKGAGFTAKRGTAVRNISLVSDNAGHIEGRVESQRIVILTEFVKKS
ncbi:MAG: alkylphosphonate utilization protein [Planktotalea sp.]|uniref:alkylphosphonate utilization protein n=1 Tax=Planktotalea sp. TaxID=2029877 RepID=UPI003C725F38